MMKWLLRIADALAWAVIGCVMLGGATIVGWVVWIALSGAWSYLSSRDGEGLRYGLLFAVLVCAAVRWLSWRSARRRVPILEEAE